MFKNTWSRDCGYEVSTAGDRRFSALVAQMPDGRTIEMHYQCDVKGYDPGGRNWRRGKGKPPIRRRDLWPEYLSLWCTWAHHNPGLMDDLQRVSGLVLRDRFARTEVNQAHALAVLLTERRRLQALFGTYW